MPDPFGLRLSPPHPTLQGRMILSMKMSTFNSYKESLESMIRTPLWLVKGKKRVFTSIYKIIKIHVSIPVYTINLHTQRAPVFGQFR